MTRLFIVRHGNTFEADEAPRRIGARTDIPLTRRGLEQAGALGCFFADRGIHFGTVLAAPLLRAWRTASTILAFQHDPPSIERAEWLVEIDHGPDEGIPEAQVVQRIGEQALERWDEQGVPPSGWIVNGGDRIAAWRRFAASPPNGDTLLVTSNGAARFALLAIASDPPRSAKLQTGAFGILERKAAPDTACDQRAWRVVCWNTRP